MGKCRGNKEDDKTFLNILPKWNNVLDEAANGGYRNPKDATDGRLLTEALNLACNEYNWTQEDFEEYQRTLRR